MPMRCLCLLRGINVGGRASVKMEALRASFESLGLAAVQTYVQSGNVIFRTGKLPTEALARRIEKKLLEDFATPIRALVLTAGELNRVVGANPFLKDAKIDPARLHVTFLSAEPGRESARKLGALATGRDEYRLAGRAVYLHCPDGYARTKLSNNALERALSVPATTRNWRTVTTLAGMVAE